MPPAASKDPSSPGPPPKLNLYHHPTTSSSTYNHTLENFLEFLFALYCAWALFCFIYISIRLGIWTARATRKALSVALEKTMTLEMQSAETYNTWGMACASGWCGETEEERWIEHGEGNDTGILAEVLDGEKRVIRMEMVPVNLLIRQRGNTI
ncbi:hypothetical protein IQ07DRAFT_233079 [Pyrenochaeta sp. DS3sAY3a]|nr:hypothetical protein IQ07DRAFT_233079 [Pyrenochaeta sp. DS3sAY3a]